MTRRRPMERVGDLLDATARRLGLERELQQARAAGTWEAVVAELVPAAAGASRLVAVEGDILVVDADAPIVAQELRLRSPDLLAAMRAAPGGIPAREVRVRVVRV
jgi:predicted nucleic acid-binding Zn ribbon protein